MPVTRVSGGRVEVQGLCKAAGVDEPGGYQLTSLSSMVSLSLGL